MTIAYELHLRLRFYCSFGFFLTYKLDSVALRIRYLLFKFCILIIVDVVSFPSVQTVLADYIKKYVYPGKF